MALITPGTTVDDAALLAGPDPHAPRPWTDGLKRMIAEPRVLRPLFRLLRALTPVVRLPGGSLGRAPGQGATAVVVTRAAEVREVIARPDDFTIAEINAARIEKAAGPFILGFDRGPAFDRELAALRAAGGPTDAERIGAIVRHHAAAQLAPRLAGGSIDAVNGYARPVALGLTADYLGVPGPDRRTMARWCRALFEYTFLSDDARATTLTDRYAPEMAAYLRSLIADRRRAQAGGAPAVTVLDRLLAAEGGQPWLDDDAVRRNISGLIVGAIDTTSKAATFALVELLARPDQLADAAAAARAHDLERLRHHVHESLRFRPHQPLLARHCAADTSIGGHRIRAGATVIAATLSARFDPREVDAPAEYRLDRDLADDLTFGTGMHECFGRFVNEVSLPLLVGGLAALAGVARRGRMRWDGPFPDHLELTFDAGQPLPTLLTRT